MSLKIVVRFLQNSVLNNPYSLCAVWFVLFIAKCEKCLWCVIRHDQFRQRNENTQCGGKPQQQLFFMNFFLEQYYDKGFPFLPSQKWKLLVFFRSRSPKKHNAWKFTSAPHKTWLTSWSHPKPQEWWRPLSDILAHEVVIILMIPA